MQLKLILPKWILNRSKASSQTRGWRAAELYVTALSRSGIYT